MPRFFSPSGIRAYGTSNRPQHVVGNYSCFTLQGVQRLGLPGFERVAFLLWDGISLAKVCLGIRVLGFGYPKP